MYIYTCIQNHAILDKPRKMLDKILKYLTRVTTNINLTFIIKCPTLKTTAMNQKGITINKKALNRAL